MTVLELRNRGGQLLHRSMTDREVITVGRAFDNDVIVDDIYVSPHHLRLTRTENGWHAEDLDSLNGIQRKHQQNGAGPVSSGDQLRIGHTVLHVYEREHQPAGTLKLDRAESILSGLGRHALWVVPLVVLFQAVHNYINSWSEVTWLDGASNVIDGVLPAVIIAAGWALLGRLLRHRTHYFAHLCIWLVADAIPALGAYCTSLVGYNTGAGTLESVANQVLQFGSLAVAFWASLLLATAMRRRTQVLTVAGVGLAAGAVFLIDHFRFSDNFNYYPDYYGRVKQPVFLWRQPVPDEDVRREMPEIFDEADRLMRESQEDD